MSSRAAQAALAVVVLGGGGALGWTIYQRLEAAEGGGRAKRKAPLAAVAVAPVEVGRLEQRRTFGGTIEAAARFVTAPKVSGRILQLHVDVGDAVKRGQLIAELDRAEYDQAVRQAEAEEAVARANLQAARSALVVAEREVGRVTALVEKGVTMSSQLDEERARVLTREAAVKVAEAQLQRARSAIATARIRLGYTRVVADWSGGAESRVVAQRFVNEGDTVSANTPLVSVVQLSPLTGVVFVTERDYGLIEVGRPVRVRTDAFPTEVFTGKVRRIAPVFRASSRQARIELEIPNEQERLKPGMFLRATIVLEALKSARVIPEAALTRRNGNEGVFVVRPGVGDGPVTVRWQPVEVGIRESGRVQILSPALEGRVVTVGQHLIQDGSKVVIPDSGAELLEPAGDAVDAVDESGATVTAGQSRDDASDDTPDDVADTRPEDEAPEAGPVKAGGTE